MCFTKLKNYLKAEEFYNNAKIFTKNISAVLILNTWKILSKLAKVYYMEKDYKRSKKNIEEALNDYDLFTLSNIFRRWANARKQNTGITMKGDFDFIIRLPRATRRFSRLGRQSVQLSIAHQKHCFLSSSIKFRERIQNSADENLKVAYNTWVEKKEFLTKMHFRWASQQLVQNGIDPAALGAEVEKLERELSEKIRVVRSGFWK